MVNVWKKGIWRAVCGLRGCLISSLGNLDQQPTINQLIILVHKPTSKTVRFCGLFFIGFTGKEKDEEMGYGYFGARYMDHELMTMWQSVDPMATN